MAMANRGTAHAAWPGWTCMSSMATLHYLHCLMIMRQCWYQTTLESLHLGGFCDLVDISVLPFMQRLRRLSLKDSRYVTDITALWSLSSLRELELSGLGIVHMGPVPSMVWLRELNIGWCDSLQNVGCLTGLTNLDALAVQAKASTVAAPFQLRQSYGDWTGTGMWVRPGA